ncbi:choline dehydrogenase [Colletotrichum cuscutae]|uniref:Choline dehydrogenase n=1 Tax=Colletotrichum cuscutae TaxID=1209917 RepID=A0AAI9YDH1_9PEZI|nr:choline dehydrogenase [Colletotrichum cuscutae]
MFPVASILALYVAAVSAAPGQPTDKAFDYIVIGGGTAGVALSTRLSRGLQNATVLVIEAGPSGLGDERIEIPGRRGGIKWPRLGRLRTSIADGKSLSKNFTSANTQYYTGSEGVSNARPIKALINRLIPKHQAPLFPVMNSLGIETNLESLNGNVLGVLYSPNSIEPTHYNRSYSANSYLPLASPNHFVLTDSKVAKVNLKTTYHGSQRTTGVSLVNRTVLTTRREVIVSGGGLLSPSILENSGISRADILSATGINQIINLPGVGKNLHHHIRIQSSYELKSNYTRYDRLKYDTVYAAKQLQLWRQSKTSIYGYSRKILFSDRYTGVKGYPASGSPGYSKDYFTLIAAIIHPLSRGHIHVNPADPLGPPLIDPNYLSNEYDLQAAIQAIKKCRQVALTEPLRSTTTLSIYHPVGSYAMLPKEDSGVVNPSLKVYGAENLRVVDASIMPVLISAHIQTAIYGIAERAADIIIEAAKKL